MHADPQFLLRLAFISMVGCRFIDLLQPPLFYLLTTGPIFGVHLTPCAAVYDRREGANWRSLRVAATGTPQPPAFGGFAP